MNLEKSYEYFQPEKADGNRRLHIVGCGSVGSALAENLVRCGLTRFTLWDFDLVEPHNLANQMFREKDIKRNKAEALLDLLCEINPEVRDVTKVKTKGWQGEKLSGYIFLCVDSIELRRKIVEQHLYSPDVLGVFDFRTRLEDAQHYAADWGDPNQKDALLRSMDFSHEEAAEETPTSACGTTLGVCPTVRAICAMGVANFMNFVKGRTFKTVLILDVFNCGIMSFDAVKPEPREEPEAEALPF